MTLNGDGKDINVLSRMTPQEETIKWFEEETQRLPDDSSNKALLKVAIEALQKQIPMEPNNMKYYPKIDLWVGNCSNCDECENSRVKHCPNCGQKFDEGRKNWRN